MTRNAARRIQTALTVPLLEPLIRTYVSEVRAQADQESADYRANTSVEAADRRLAAVVLTVLSCLIALRFYGSTERVGNVLELLRGLGLDAAATRFDHWMHQAENHRFHQRIFWASARAFIYLVVPVCVIKLVLRGSLVDYGGRWRGVLASGRTYLFMFAIIAPFVVGASFTAGFQAKYPYYRMQAGESVWPWLIGWELLYALQFVGLEFFYRGFLLHGIRHRVGYPAVYMMMMPYMMIHLGKPLPECVGSIIAGFVLGTLSLKSGSVWWGAAIHIAVAWLMDGLSLWHQGHLP